MRTPDLSAQKQSVSHYATEAQYWVSSRSLPYGLHKLKRRVCSALGVGYCRRHPPQRQRKVRCIEYMILTTTICCSMIFRWQRLQYTVLVVYSLPDIDLWLTSVGLAFVRLFGRQLWINFSAECRVSSLAEHLLFIFITSLNVSLGC